MAKEVQEFQAKLTTDDQASKPIDAVAKKLDAVTKDPHEVELTADEQDALDAIHDIKDRAADLVRRLETDDAKLDVDTSTVNRKLDDTRQKGEGLTGGAVNSLSDLTGPLGDVSGDVGAFGQAFVGAAELAGPQLEAIGVDVGKLAGVLGVGGAALGAVIYFWNTFVGGADAANSKIKDVQESMAAGDFTKAAKGITDALQPWRQTMDDVGLSVTEATKFISGQTDVLPLNADAVADATSKQHFLAGELQRQRTFWADNHQDLANHQTDQFNATKAIGVTVDNLGAMTSALLGQARVAQPEVQKQILAYTAMVNGIPQSRFTEITTDANPDDVKQVEDEINNAARDRDSTVNVDADTSRAEQQIRGLMDTMSNSVFFLHPKAAAPTTSAAGGGTAPSAGPTAAGMSVVGAPTPSVGSPARPGAGTIVNNYVTVMVPVGHPTAEVGRYVADALDAHERRNGSRRKVI